MPTRGRERVSEQRCFFITTTCREWLHLLESKVAKEICYQSLEHCCREYEAEMIAYVIMPNHIHMVLYFDEVNRLSDFMREFKKYTSTRIRDWVRASKPKLLEKIRLDDTRQRFQVWKPRFHDQHIRTRKLMERVVNYIHMNPVEADLCYKAEYYNDSSASFYFDGQIMRLEITPYHDIV